MKIRSRSIAFLASVLFGSFLACACATSPPNRTVRRDGGSESETSAQSFTQHSQDQSFIERPDLHVFLHGFSEGFGEYFGLNSPGNFVRDGNYEFKWTRVYTAATQAKAKELALAAMEDFQLNAEEIGRLQSEIFSVVARRTAPWESHDMELIIRSLGWKLDGEVDLCEHDGNGRALVLSKITDAPNHYRTYTVVNGFSLLRDYKQRLEDDLKGPTTTLSSEPAVALTVRLHVIAGVSVEWKWTTDNPR